MSRANDLIQRLPRFLRPLVTAARAVRHGELPRPIGPAIQWVSSVRPRDHRAGVLHKMTRDRRRLLVLYADKLAVRQFVIDRAGPEAVTQLYAAGRRAADIDWGALPREFVVKVNHGCGGVVVVSDAAPEGSGLPALAPRVEWIRSLVHPDALDRDLLQAHVDRWLSSRYSQGAFERKEWVYTQIDPRVLVEESVASDGRLPRQLRLYCFEGRIVEFLIHDVDGEAFAETEVGRYFTEHLDEARRHAGLDDDQWSFVTEASSRLSREADMVRIDWLIRRGRPYFSEITNYPSAGKGLYAGSSFYSPREVSERLFSYWRIPDYRAPRPELVALAERYLNAPPPSPPPPSGGA